MPTPSGGWSSSEGPSGGSERFRPGDRARPRALISRRGRVATERAHRSSLRLSLGARGGARLAAGAELISDERRPDGEVEFQIEAGRRRLPDPRPATTARAGSPPARATRSGAAGREGGLVAWQRLLVAQVTALRRRPPRARGLHASAVVVGGEAVAFTGRSGTRQDLGRAGAGATGGDAPRRRRARGRAQRAGSCSPTRRRRRGDRPRRGRARLRRRGIGREPRCWAKTSARCWCGPRRIAARRRSGRSSARARRRRSAGAAVRAGARRPPPARLDLQPPAGLAARGSRRSSRSAPSSPGAGSSGSSSAPAASARSWPSWSWSGLGRAVEPPLRR